MDDVINRIENELNKWHAQESRFSKLFSFDISRNRGVLKEKLNYYNRIAAKYKDTHNPDERLALKLLRYERNRVEKLLYTNLLMRLFRRLIVTPLNEQMMIRQDDRRMEQNIRKLYHPVLLAGFPDLSGKIRENMRRRLSQFSIPVSRWPNEKESIDYNLTFSKAGTEDYRLDGYEIALNKKGNENRRRYFSMHQEHKINSTEAFNLLSGRSVLKSDTWLQLDFNDKDAHGNFRLKQFIPGYDFDLEKALRRLPLKTKLDEAVTYRLIKSLQQGDSVLVSLAKGRGQRQCYIEANPSLKSFNIYDEQSGKITLRTPSGNRSKEVVRVAHKAEERPQNKVSRKAGIRIGT